MPRLKQASDKPSSNKKSESAAKPSSSVLTPFPAPARESRETSLEEQIRRRAYEIYEQRGRQEGLSEQDWLQAEAEIAARTGKRTA